MFENIISTFRNAAKIGIFVHVNPDGDAMGSAYSLKLALCGMGKKAEVFLAPEADNTAKKLVLGQEDTGILMEDCDLLAALDCGDSKRLGEYSVFFVNHPNTVALDHHVTHQPYAKEWVMREVSSTCELMADLYDEMGIDITKDIANNLYVGLVSDTGNFKYSCVTSETFRIAARLVETGIDFAYISKSLFDTKSREYYELMKTALNRLKFFEDGRVCVLCLEQKDFAEAGIEESDAQGIVTIPSSIDGVAVGVFIRRRENGEYKISLRSSGTVDVAKIAAVLGGGGHTRASGFSAFNMDADDIIKTVLYEVKKQI